MNMMPLSEKGMMSNSILEFVLRHPELQNPIEAYNEWTKIVKNRVFPWDDPETPGFCLHIFDFCLRQDRKILEEVHDEEMRILREEMQN